MKDYRITHGSNGGLWKYFYPAFFCAACLPQLLSAASLNQDSNCTITDKNNPGYQTDCQDSNKHGGIRDTIIVAEDEVINVFASDSNKTVIAINGGHHHDTIINHGEIYLQVTNTGEIIPLWHYGDKKSPFYSKAGKKLSGAYKPTIKKPAFWLFNLVNIPLDAIGIAGGHGNDIITNYGLLDVSVITTLTDEAGIAQTYSIGITGDKGNDQLVNEGQLNVTSDAVVTVDDVTFSLINSGDAQRKAMAIAKGVTGNKGKDEIINKGQLTVTANATVDTADFNITLLGGPVDVDASSEAWAGAIGLDGGEGHDHIYNEGIMTVTANALVDSDNVSIDLIDIPGGKSVRAPLSANAMAIGIVGGEGHDYIYNSGNLNVVADAKANALDVQITGLSLSTGGANTTSEAIAIGIHGGNGQDDIYNDGNITVKAKANTNTDNFNVTVFDLSFIPPLFGFEDEQVATTATSEAIGIIAGDGNDMVTNTGSLLVQSDATVDVDGLAISLLGLGSEVNRTAMARVTGITGDHGNDYIKNIGQLDTTSNAKLDLLSISVDLLGGAINIDASNQAMASAIGIDGGDGHDYIFNQGSTNVTANASVKSVDVGISLLSALQGQDIRAPIYVDADASGLLGGEGHDYIENTGSLAVTADARADALDMDFSAIDISSGGMSTTSEASALGIDGGKGKSEIYNEGNITIKSTATTDTESFAFTLVDLSIVSDIVDLIFDTPVDASTTAKADGTGIKTGYNHDLISNHGSLSVTVDAITNTFEMSMSADGVSNFTELSAFPDFFLEEPVIDTSTTAEASVTGITSGHGHDEITNTGTLFTKAKADVTANSIGIDLPLPDLLPQILPNIDTNEVETAARASAMGITTGDGHDTVQNDGSVWSEAIANTNSLSVNATLDVPIIPDPIDYNIPYSIEANLVDVGAQSEAEAVGIETGKGHDYIYSIGDVTAKAATSSIATNIAATVAYSDDKVSFGVSLANASTEGKATAFGITSGSGNDWLHITGNILADSFVDTNSTAVTVDLQLQKDTIIGIGASATRANTEAETNSIGIKLGKGNDDAYNEGSITARAHNNADAVAVDVGVTIPVGDKFGIIGEGNWVSTDTIATSSADGMLGGDGRDYIFNSGTVSADAFSDSNSVGVTANASGTKKGASIGIALTQANTEGTATSNGIRGGQDKDKLINTGTINSKAKTDVDAVSVAASLTLTDKGVALTGTAADGSTNATSTASGMTGDEGEDVIHNEGTVDVLADADAESYSVSVAASGASKGVALGLALSRATSEADANSKGISGGSHDDEIYSSGLVKSHARANVIAGTVSVAGGGTGKGLTVEGAAADGSTTANATATGITGDQGEDHILNEGMVDVLADVDATSVSIGVTANGTGTGATIGIALGRATSKAEANSYGIRGGSDSDSIANSGTVKSHALTTVIAGSGALAAGGAGKGLTVEAAGVDAATNANSIAKGITGDEGYVYIFNEGDVDVLADADATSVSVAVSANGTGTGVTFGLGLARATSEAEADSAGLSGGNYGDKIFNKGSVKSHALSNVIAGSGALAAGGSGTGLTLEGAAADGSTNTISTAAGINGKHGNDHIINKGTLDVLADADATSVSVAVSANGTGTGVTLGIGLARATSEADANSLGISGGEGKDMIASWDKVKSHAKSTVIAGSGALAAGGAGTGVTIEGAAADGLSKGYATASGITGDKGDDTLQSEGELDVYAEANTTSVSVAVSANGTGTGVSAGVALARATSEGEANSRGISGGDDNDHISNTKLLKAHAKSDVDAVSVSAAMGGTGTGVAIQGAAADAATVSIANTTGISGDSGIDKIYNEGTLDVLADADATSVSVGVSVSGTGAGVGLGISLARAGTEAISNATGISLGATDDVIEEDDKPHHDKDHNDDKSHEYVTSSYQDDKSCNRDDKYQNDKSCNKDDHDKRKKTEYLENHGEITARSYAEADSVSVSVQLGITGAGLQAGGALADASTKANATAKAIEGSQHKDIIINYGSIEAISDADSTTTSVGVSLNADLKGATLSVAVTDATAIATAHSTGIAGLKGDDEISNQGTVTAKSDAETDAVSVSVPIGISFVPLSVGLADTTATADADAFGIHGGEGNDYLENSGIVLADADSEADGISVSVAPIGVSLVGANINADSTAVGMEGASGNDTIYQSETASLTADTTANATGTVVSVTLIGAAGTILDDNNSTAMSQSIGISGGAGFDHIENLGNIYSGANSTATGTSVGVSLIGAAFADISTTARSNATAIDTGDGDDNVFNQGVITVDAVSTGQGTSVAAGLIGNFDADASTIVDASAAGIKLGSGNDEILNKGNIDIAARTGANLTAGSGVLIGWASSTANINSSVVASGIAGGDGNDLIINKASVTVGPATEVDPWMSRLTSTSFSLNLIGSASAGSELFSITQSTGLDGGAGNDHMFNESELDVTASSYSSSSSSSFSLAGVASSKATITTDAQATGMTAGIGADQLVNKGDIDVKANTFANSDASSLTIFGGANTNSGILGTATATGMVSGGDEGDEIANLGLIDVLATSLATANGDSFSLIGGATSDAFITADANANGIIGSQGNDNLYNNGSINVVATSTAEAGQDASVGLIGDVAAGADIVSNAIARGMSANEGNDHIQNEGDINVSVTVSGAANSDSQTGWFEGDGDSDSNGNVSATGIGFELAAGNNTLNNMHSVQVSALATMNASATADGSNFADGNAVSDAGSTARSFVYGVWADDGNNTIGNHGDITLTSNTLTTANTNADGDGFFGFGDGRATSNAGNGEVSPLAAGIRLGDGDHRINNNGLIALNVTGTADANARADGDLVTASADADATASMAATVYGIQVGDGELKLHNAGDIIAEATVHAFAYAIANPSADPDGWGNADATTSATVDGAGITTGSGQHEIINAGNITVRLKANPDASVDNRDAEADGDGDARYSTADTIANAGASGSGISTKSYEGWILNMGSILVESQANAAPRTVSKSDWTADTRGTGKSTVNANAKGVVVNGDDNTIVNDGQVTVNARANAAPEVIADTWGWGSNADVISENTASVIADGLLVTGNNNEITNLGEIQVSGQSDVNSRVRAEATDGPDANGNIHSGSHATAITNVNGIHSIDGADWIHNFGRIEVAAISVGQMDSDALGGGIDGDARAYATGIAQASAYGIRSDQLNPGNSAILDDVIVNKADIIVSANANAFASAWAEEDAGGTSSELASGTATAIARSFGIHTGNGNDTIINRGLIDVTAIASASVSVDTEDNDREYRNPSASTEAVGIFTGAGDDVIKNKGTIIAARTWNGVTFTGTAIDSGSGNDRVFLAKSSSVTGNINLGANDDTLHIFEAPVVNGSISGGSDTDTVVFYGEGTFSNPLTSFENTIKEDPGTYKLTELAPMQQITVKQGVLEIDGDYEFAAGSTYMPSVSNGDGQGKLVINGAVNFSAASINVMKGRGHHLDGEKQTVLYASEGILNSMSFNNIKLPEKTPLLEFHHEITADEVQVSTSVESFKSVASSNNQRIIAHYMDGLLPNAKGDVSETLGEIQAMKAGGHASAFNSVNPEPYVNTQQAVSLGVKQYTTTLHQRTRGLRNLQQHKQFTQPGFFSFEQGDALINLDGTVGVDVIMLNRQRSLRQYGSWFKSYHQNGQLDRSATNTGFDFDMTGAAFGFDKWMHKNWVIGGSMAQNTTDLNVDGVSSNSDIKSQLFSFYTTYMTDTGYIDGSLSSGSNDYTTRRDVTVGPISDTVISEHAGNSYAASFGGGLYFPVNTWKMELFANMNYQQEDEEGFRESGAGGISLDVAARSTDSLVSETGIRFGKHLKQRYSSWFTELGLAWVHEFNNDQSVQASFVDTPGSSFTVYGQEIEDGLVFSAGLNYTNKKGFTGSAEYRAERRGAYSDQIVSGYIQYQF